MARDVKRTLAEKYKEHFNKEDKFKLTMRDVNNIFPIWFILTMIGACYYGHCYVAPVVHLSFEISYTVEMVMYGVMYDIFGEMIVNWLCVRMVKSIFKVEDEKKLADSMPIPELQEITRDAELQTPDNVENKQENERTIENGETMVWKRFRGNGQIYAVKMKKNDTKGNIDPEKTVMYPYWSWKPCLICQHSRPPRTHHCPLCQACMLKRDHHCFFTGSCIAMNNQRHFIVFSFWSVLATSFSLIYSCIYIYVIVFDLGILELYDIFLPQLFVDWVVGNTEFYQVIIFFLIYSIVFFWVTSFKFLHDQYSQVMAGVTSFEKDNKIKIQNTNSFKEELESIFGPFWYLNFIVPLHLLFPLKDNGKDWPNIKQ
ncbi:unnamed protein product [Owenia fusiformis]|uniref:Palmitoyltransferase n=1 Tax=Owenia fusiformis TaxID=6347 RepID=A0A8J1UGS2_OWEFU|nr:unnamed protein product [Owenia fusiformis]